MIVAAARMLAGASTVLVGIGQPNLAANLARRVHNPNVVLVYESGVIGARPERLPVSIGDPALVTRAQCVLPMMDLFSFILQGGQIDVGFLEGVQIDRFGNINTTVIGSYEHPTVRLAGSGGACEIASLARRTIILARHERRRFAERVDFVTSPGYLRGKAERRRAGLAGGPNAVITDLAILRFDDATGEMYLDAVHPGVGVERVLRETGWPLRLAAEIGETPAPTAAEMSALSALRASRPS
jgi:glutaconate CoA-transferase subunit B